MSPVYKFSLYLLSRAGSDLKNKGARSPLGILVRVRWSELSRRYNGTREMCQPRGGDITIGRLADSAGYPIVALFTFLLDRYLFPIIDR